MSRSRNTSLLLPWIPVVALLLPAACSGEQQGGDKGAPSSARGTQTGSDLHPILGETMRINGEEVPHDRIKQHLVVSFGSQLLDMKKLQIHIDQEIERRRIAGEDVTPYLFDTEYADEQLATAEAELAGQFEDEVRIDEVWDLPGGRRTLRKSIGQREMFDRLFLPRNPYEWPPVSAEALSDPRDTGLGNMYETRKDGWDNMMEMEAAGEVVVETPANVKFFNNILRPEVIAELDERAVVLQLEDGLPPNVVMRVGSVDVTVDDMWDEVKDAVRPLDVKHSKQWILNTDLAIAELKKAGFWLSDEEFNTRYQEEIEPYAKSPFHPELIAQSIRKFPSVSDFRLYRRIEMSFEQMIADEINDDTLLRLIDRMDLYVSGLVDVDIILLSAYDFANDDWKPNGWADAQRRAEEATAKLSQGVEWDEVMQEYNEFPLAPRKKEDGGVAGRQKRVPGRFVSLDRNTLLQKLGDNDYETFLNSSSLGDYIFFEQEIGTIKNPTQGKFGFYISKLESRVLTNRNEGIKNETHRELLKEDFIRQRLNYWLYELKSQTKAEGLNLYMF